ncbi:TetR/AcrR family transcriptional regulator [Nocardia wallacei]|uniref:TetR/AcrR family transcriptional regulator n=1 Tax=Nocardia wallacei TaxID=480035 RepID=UPI002455FA5E|nr:helix-turn-helix domain-containing protein [Nocardia wallacei]
MPATVEAVATASKPSLSRVDAVDESETRILDAALIQFQKVGVKKTTIEDVARQAGVDRVTVYRRMGSRDDLVQAVINREVAAVLTELAEIPERHDDISDLVADVFVTVVTRWRTNPLVERMLAVEPERVVMKLTVDGATTFAMCVSATAAALDAAVQRGLLEPSPDLMTRAEIVCRIVHSMVLAPEGVAHLSTDADLSTFARTYLTPIITGR